MPGSFRTVGDGSNRTLDKNNICQTLFSKQVSKSKINVQLCDTPSNSELDQCALLLSFLNFLAKSDIAPKRSFGKPAKIGGREKG